MRRATLITCLGLAALATSASAQIVSPTHYDLYYVLPDEAGSKGADIGISAADIGSIDDGVVNALGKYSVNDKVEVGARLGLGLLNDDLEMLSTVTVGAKYSLRETCAASAALLAPTGDADDPGLSLGFMHTHKMGDAMINNWLQVGLLDGYTGGTGINLHLLVEPTKAFGDKLTGYVDVLVHTNTDDIAGDWLGIDLGPNVDYKVCDKAVVNAGLTLGLVGDAKLDDLGLVVTLVSRF